MPLTVRKFNAQVKDPTTGEMIPAGLLSSDSLEAIEAAETAAVAAVGAKQAVSEAAIELKGATTLASIPVEYTALEDEVDDLKTQINEIYSDQIVGMTETGNIVVSANLFKYAQLIEPGKVIYSLSYGKVVLTDSENYDTYIIPVDGVSVYTFTNCRTAAAISDLEYTAVGNIATYATTVDSTGGKYILFSFSANAYPTTSYSITKPENEYFVPENWNISKKTIETPQIEGMEKTGRMVSSSNLFAKANLIATGKYVDRIRDGKAILSNNANLDTYIIHVDGINEYSFTFARTAAVVSDLEYTAVSTLIQNATTIDSSGGNYILFSFNPTTYPITDYSITKPVDEYDIPNNWNTNKESKAIYQRKTGSLSDGGSISLDGKTAIKYGQQIIFKGFISQFNEIELDFYNYNDSAISNKIVIGTEDIKIYIGNTLSNDSAQHGLTIINYISLVLDYTKDGVRLTLYSNGNSFTLTTSFEILTSGIVSPTIKSTGTICTSAVFEKILPITNKRIWYFGDSYISFTNPARWPYYMLADNYDYILLCGYAGGTSYTTQTALQALLNYGKPDIAVFATGMNDGSDVDENTPSTSWVNARNIFLNVCEKNGIIPVFGTIPNVPTINNKGKNTWIRNSGYRYVDFANAVGSENSNTWYDGMLEVNSDPSKRVHSTISGAKALYTQLLVDLPEILDPK